MITKFNEYINEGFTKNLFNSSTEDIIIKANEKISEFGRLCKRASYGDEKSFVVYVYYCKDVIDAVKKLEKKKDKEEINIFIKKALNAIANSWPEEIEFDRGPKTFVNMITDVIVNHEELSAKYNTDKIEVEEFKRKPIKESVRDLMKPKSSKEIGEKIVKILKDSEDIDSTDVTPDNVMEFLKDNRLKYRGKLLKVGDIIMKWDRFIIKYLGDE
jgi:hypothetical protein